MKDKKTFDKIQPRIGKSYLNIKTSVSLTAM